MSKKYILEEETENVNINLADETKTYNTYTAKLKSAKNEEQRLEIVKNFFRDVLKFTDADLKKVENIIPSITQAVSEVGLSEDAFPLLTWVKNYYLNLKRQPLPRDQYIRLHNLYSGTRSIDKTAFTGETSKNNPEGLNNILYNPSLYQYQEKDVENIAEAYFNIAKPENIILPNNTTVTLDKNSYSVSDIKKNADTWNNFKQQIFLDDGKVRPFAVIAKALKNIFGENNVNERIIKNRWADLKNILENEAILVKTDLDVLKQVIIAMYNKYGLDKDQELKDKLFKEYNLDDKSLESYNKNNTKELENIYSVFDRNKDVIDSRTAPALFLLAFSDKNKPNSGEKQVKKNTEKTVNAKINVNQKKFDYLKEWCRDRINNTKLHQQNVYKYMIMALSEYAGKSGLKNTPSHPISERTNKVDAEIYDNYVKPSIIANKNLDKKRYEFFKKCPEFNSNRFINKEVVRKLIPYLYSTYKEV